MPTTGFLEIGLIVVGSVTLTVGFAGGGVPVPVSGIRSGLPGALWSIIRLAVRSGGETAVGVNHTLIVPWLF
jgi:hypothetical protein